MDERKECFIIDNTVYTKEDYARMVALKEQNAMQIKHDGLPSGYVTDKELFEWALVGVEGRLSELEQELMTWSLKRLGDEKYVELRKHFERVGEKRVYLKEVLDGLG